MYIQLYFMYHHDIVSPTPYVTSPISLYSPKTLLSLWIHWVGLLVDGTCHWHVTGRLTAQSLDFLQDLILQFYVYLLLSDMA